MRGVVGADAGDDAGAVTDRLDDGRAAGRPARRRSWWATLPSYRRSPARRGRSSSTRWVASAAAASVSSRPAASNGVTIALRTCPNGAVGTGLMAEGYRSGRRALLRTPRIRGVRRPSAPGPQERSEPRCYPLGGPGSNGASRDYRMGRPRGVTRVSALFSSAGRRRPRRASVDVARGTSPSAAREGSRVARSTVPSRPRGSSVSPSGSASTQVSSQRVGDRERLRVDLGTALDEHLAVEVRGQGERSVRDAAGRDADRAAGSPSGGHGCCRVTTTVVRPGSGRPIDSYVRRPMTSTWPIVVCGTAAGPRGGATACRRHGR